MAGAGYISGMGREVEGTIFKQPLSPSLISLLFNFASWVSPRISLFPFLNFLLYIRVSLIV